MRVSVSSDTTQHSPQDLVNLLSTCTLRSTAHSDGMGVSIPDRVLDVAQVNDQDVLHQDAVLDLESHVDRFRVQVTDPKVHAEHVPDSAQQLQQVSAGDVLRQMHRLP